MRPIEDPLLCQSVRLIAVLHAPSSDGRYVHAIALALTLVCEYTRCLDKRQIICELLRQSQPSVVSQEVS